MKIHQSSLLLLPILASPSFALPSKRTKGWKKLFRKEYAGTGEFANSEADSVPSFSIGVASTLPATAYLPASTNSAGEPLPTGLNSVPQAPGDISSESISALIAQTTAFNSFSYSDYTAATQSATSSANAPLVTGNGGAIPVGPGSDDPGNGTGPTNNWIQPAVEAAEEELATAIADAGSGTMPTVTLHIVMSPTQEADGSWDYVVHIGKDGTATASPTYMPTGSSSSGSASSSGSNAAPTFAEYLGGPVTTYADIFSATPTSGSKGYSQSSPTGVFVNDLESSTGDNDTTDNAGEMDDDNASDGGDSDGDSDDGASDSGDSDASGASDDDSNWDSDSEAGDSEDGDSDDGDSDAGDSDSEDGDSDSEDGDSDTDSDAGDDDSDSDSDSSANSGSLGDLTAVPNSSSSGGPSASVSASQTPTSSASSSTATSTGCTEGDWQCQGQTLQMCNYGNWVTMATCSGQNIVCAANNSVGLVGCVWSWDVTSTSMPTSSSSAVDPANTQGTTHGYPPIANTPGSNSTVPTNGTVTPDDSNTNSTDSTGGTTHGYPPIANTPGSNNTVPINGTDSTPNATLSISDFPTSTPAPTSTGESDNGIETILTTSWATVNVTMTSVMPTPTGLANSTLTNSTDIANSTSTIGQNLTPTPPVNATLPETTSTNSTSADVSDPLCERELFDDGDDFEEVWVNEDEILPEWEILV